MAMSHTTWEFWFTVRKAGTILERELEAIIKRELKITFDQYVVLSVIDAYPGTLNLTAIADHLGLAKATVSRLVESGVGAGWITVDVDPKSRRSRLVSLTAAGTDLVRRGDKALEASPMSQYPADGAPQAQTTIEMLQEFITHMRGYGGHATAGLPPKAV